MVRSNDPGRVNRGKGYRVVNWLDCFDAIWDVDDIHSGSGCGCSQQPPLLIDICGSLWNQARVSPFMLAGNTLHSKRLFHGLSIIVWLKCSM